MFVEVEFFKPFKHKMSVKLKNRKFVQFSLIVCILLIQIIIFLFFYNEYFNENKLSEIRTQLENSKKIKKLTNESKYELVNAQNHLNDYLNELNKDDLEIYFESIQNITAKIDSTQAIGNSIPTIKLYESEENQLKLEHLEKLIDSVYNHPPALNQVKIPSGINNIDLSSNPPEIEIEEIYVSDTVPRKKFFPRLKDAFSGNVDVRTDTVFITMKLNNSIDTIKVKNDFENALNVISEFYSKELLSYRNYLSSIQETNHSVYHEYNELINLSNHLIEVYDSTSDELSSQLEKQFNERFSQNNKIRRAIIFGLMVLMFVVLFIVAYFTKLSFVYERKLKDANDRIQNNLKFKNRILGMLSHEVRSPLKIVNLFIDRIHKKTDDKVITDSLKSIRFTNDSLLIQANQILEYTKNQDKPIELIPVEFNLKEEIDSILTIFKPYIESVNNRLEIANEIKNDIFVFADKAKIHQLFINLLGNANKFTQNGKILVALRTVNLSENKLKLITSIQDTGVGISENDIDKIFDPYFKGMILEDVENLGVGLGLNLCKEIIELLEGEISIESELGKGTSINFEINLKISNEQS